MLVMDGQALSWFQWSESCPNISAGHHSQPIVICDFMIIF